MPEPTDEQVEAAAKAMSEASSGFFSEGSWRFLAREALGAAFAVPKPIVKWGFRKSDRMELRAPRFGDVVRPKDLVDHFRVVEDSVMPTVGPQSPLSGYTPPTPTKLGY